MRYTISTKPRLGAASFTSLLSETPSLASSTSSASSAHTLTSHHKCPHCPKEFANDSAWCQNQQRADAAAPTGNRRKVTVEEVPDEGGTTKHPIPPARQLGTEPGPLRPTRTPATRVDPEPRPTRTATGDTSASTRADPEPDLSRSTHMPAARVDPEPRPTRTPVVGRDRTARRQLRRRGGLYVEDFPDPLAGSPISEERAPLPDLEAYMQSCGRMAEPEVFEVAELLMTSGMTDAAKDRHLKSRLYQGQTPWCGCNAMLSDVDKLRHGPPFELIDIDIYDGRRNRPQYMVARNIVQVIRDMFANPEFKNDIKYGPEKLWTSASKKERVYGDTNTSQWWWNEQEALAREGKRNATIASLVIASDPTTLSIMCGGQKAYPVYASLANVSKGVRRKSSKRAMVLLGYLPIDAFEDIENDDERRRLKAELVHRSMERMLAPLREASENGVDMWCSDGYLRRVYPRIAAYTADWPEQNLQSCTSEGSCPVCKTTFAGRGDLDQEAELRDREQTLGVLRSYFMHKSVAELKPLSLKPVWPWWGDIPYVNLATCFTPDLLHQIYQGMFKTHLLRWLKYLVGTKTLDERFAAMPIAEGMRHFTKGITGVSQWTGRESKQMMAQIVPVVIGDLDNELGRMVIALMNFMFRAHAASLTETDLTEMEADLATFHRLKDSLVARGVYESSARFDAIPKLHMLRHYVHMTRQLGTPDGYNTETPEHLHIEFAKEPWRASNKVRPLPQMIKYIQRQEAIRIHRTYMDRYLGLDGDEDEDGDEVETFEVEGTRDANPDNDEFATAEGAADGGDVQPRESMGGNGGEEAFWAAPEPVTYPNPRRHIAKSPTKRQVPLRDITQQYGASNIISDIKDFLGRRHSIPSHDVLISRHNYIDIWHKLYLYHQPLAFAPFDSLRRDVVRASPPVLDTRGRTRQNAIWDVALYLERPNQLRSSEGESDKHGIQRYRAGRVRAFFTLPAHLQYLYSGPLAYVEVFTPFDTPVSSFNPMHSTKPDLDSRNQRRTLVIPISDIFLACHLVPKFHLLDRQLTLTVGTDLLALSKDLWFNNYCNHYLFQLVEHWRRRRPGLRDRLLRHVRFAP